MSVKNKFAIILFLTGGLLISIFAYQSLIDKISPSQKSSADKFYKIQPKTKANILTYFNTQVYYPDIGPPPYANFYYLSEIIEKMNIVNNDQNSLYYANKRIAEIINWRNELKIIGNSGVNDPFSWESRLKEYGDLIDKEIGAIKKGENPEENLMELRKYLMDHRYRLSFVLYDSNMAREEKNYLFQLLDNVFSNLGKKISDASSGYNPVLLKYPLRAIADDKKSGIYTAVFNIFDMPAKLKNNIYVKIQDRLIPAEKGTDNDGDFVFKNIPIDEKTNYLELMIRDFHYPIQNKSWLAGYDPAKKLYEYSARIPKIPANTDYVLNFAYTLNQKAILQMENNTNNNRSVILEEGLLPINRKVTLTRLVTFPPGPDANYQVNLISDEPLTDRTMTGIRLEFEPTIEPEILLVKTGRLTDRLPVRHHEKTVNPSKIYLPMAFCWFFLLVCFTFKKKFGKPIGWLINIFRYAVLRLRLFISIIAIISLAASLLLFIRLSFFSIMLTLVFWILTVIGYRLGEQISFLSALFFLALSAVFVVFNNQNAGETLSVYFFLLLIVGGMQKAIKPIYSDNPIIDNHRSIAYNHKGICK